MCLSPIRIKNPNLGLIGPNAQFKDTISHMIDVPCGVCAECVASRQMQYVQRLQMEELVNHVFFCTLTYNNDMMPVVETSTGFHIRYADVSDVQKMFKRLRKRNAFGRPFRYFAVSELGELRGRPHFHILFLLPRREGDTEATCLNLQSLMFCEVLREWRRNTAVNRKGKPDTRHPDYRPLCTYVRKYIHGRIRTNFDLHWVDPALSSGGSADVCFYVMKYMMKPSNRAIRLQQALRLNLDDDEYERLWSLVRPRHFESEALGYGVSDTLSPENQRLYHRVLEHLREGIEMSKREMPGRDPMPLYFSPVDGHSSPLAKYYKSNPNVFDMKDFLDFFYASQTDADNVILHKEVHYSQVEKKVDDFDKKSARVSYQQTSVELDALYSDDTDDTFIDLSE